MDALYSFADFATTNWPALVILFVVGVILPLLLTAIRWSDTDEAIDLAFVAVFLSGAILTTLGTNTHGLWGLLVPALSAILVSLVNLVQFFKRRDRKSLLFVIGFLAIGTMFLAPVAVWMVALGWFAILVGIVAYAALLVSENHYRNSPFES